jgi:gentisate 1,2-dioxygenase
VLAFHLDNSKKGAHDAAKRSTSLQVFRVGRGAGDFDIGGTIWMQYVSPYP